MSKRAKGLAIILLVAAIIFAFPLTASANSAEPPTVVIMVINGPEDLTLEVEIPDPEEGDYLRVQKVQKMWEQYFRIYNHRSLENATLRVSSSEKSFTCSFPPISDYNVYSYNTLMYLDFDAETLTVGQPAYREPLLIALRMSLTLIFEGLVFFLFGFRKKSSWIAFLIINLLTQGWLNISIASADSYSGGYMIIGFILYEALIFIAEAIALTAFVREHRWYRRLGLAFLANTVSLILGMVIINNLPI
jgi:hypothetical protein